MNGPSYSRRRVVGMLGATMALAAGCRGDGAAAAANQAGAAEPAGVPLSRFGVQAGVGRDQWKQLAAAFAAAHRDGLSLIAEPGARYLHDGPLSLDGVSFDGRGCGLVALSDGPQVLRCVGTGWRLANVALIGAATRRSSENDTCGLQVGDHAEHPATDFTIENVVVGGADGRGFAGAGAMFDRASRGRISGLTVRDTLADGIHVTNGSEDLAFARTLSERNGDDGFAVVSYVRQGRPCARIRLTGGVARETLARGFTVVGGRDVTFERIVAERCAAAGLYLFGEEAFDTYGVAGCRVAGAKVVGCVTGRGQAGDFTQSAVLLGGRPGSDRVGGATLSRGVADCTLADVEVVGGGAHCWAGLVVGEHAQGIRVERPVLRQLSGGKRDHEMSGIEIGGRDVTVAQPRLSDVEGIPFVVLTSASGRTVIDRPVVAGARTKRSATEVFNTFCYVDAAAGAQEVVIRGGTFSRGPGRVVTNLLPDKARLKTSGNRLDGRAA
jgi:hypothetical protein